MMYSQAAVLNKAQLFWKRISTTDPWRFLIMYVPIALFLSTRFRNWEVSIIATMLISAIAVFLLRKHPFRWMFYAAFWFVLYYIFVGFDPIVFDETYGGKMPTVYTELIAVNGSHRYGRTASFLNATGRPFHIQFNGPLTPVPHGDICEGHMKNKAKYAEFSRLRLLELAEKHKDKDWLFVLEDDAEPVHSLKTYVKRFNHAIATGMEYDMIWLDYRNIVSGGISPFPYGGITGILYKRTSIPAIAKTLEFDPEYCTIGTGLDEIWSVMCKRGVLKCGIVPILRENGRKTSLFVGLRPLDTFSEGLT